MPVVRWWAHGLTVFPGNVRNFAAEKKRLTRGVGAEVQVDVAYLENLALHERHVVTVHNGTAQLIQKLFQAVHPCLYSALVDSVAAGSDVDRPGFSLHTRNAWFWSQSKTSVHGDEWCKCKGGDQM